MSNKLKNERVTRVGVPELDSLLRKVRKQGGHIERKGGHLKIFGPIGERPVIAPTSKLKSTTVRNLKSKLKRKGFVL